MGEIMIDRQTLDELYLFGDQANEELGRLATINEALLEHCATLTVKADQLEKALNRAIEVMAALEKRHEHILSQIQIPQN